MYELGRFGTFIIPIIYFSLFFTREMNNAITACTVSGDKCFFWNVIYANEKNLMQDGEAVIAKSAYTCCGEAILGRTYPLGNHGTLTSIADIIIFYEDTA